MRLVTAVLKHMTFPDISEQNDWMTRNYAAPFESQETTTGRVKLQKLALVAPYQCTWPPRFVQRRRFSERKRWDWTSFTERVHCSPDMATWYATSLCFQEQNKLPLYHDTVSLRVPTEAIRDFFTFTVSNTVRSSSSARRANVANNICQFLRVSLGVFRRNMISLEYTIHLPNPVYSTWYWCHSCLFVFFTYIFPYVF
jgi:hypothetical protein